MTDHSTPPETKRRRRWVMPLLFISLAINLLVAGVILGALSQRGDRDSRADGPARSLLGAPFVQALEPEDRRALGRDILRNRDKLQKNRINLRRRFDELLEELRKEDFDRARVSSLLSEQRSLAISRQDVGETLLLDRLDSMSFEDRRRYADRLDKSLRRFKRN